MICLHSFHVLLDLWFELDFADFHSILNTYIIILMYILISFIDLSNLKYFVWGKGFYNRHIRIHVESIYCWMKDNFQHFECSMKIKFNETFEKLSKILSIIIVWKELCIHLFRTRLFCRYIHMVNRVSFIYS